MIKILLSILISFLFCSDVYAQRVTSPPQRIRFGTTVPSTCTNGMLFQDTDATAGQQIYACESGAWVLQGDGGGGGGGDNITVNTTAATNANFLDNLYIDWAIDTVATPDDVTAKFNYAETLAGNPALLTGECILTIDGIICEGTTADAIEMKLAFPDPATTDKTLTLPNETGTLCSTGSVCTGYQAGALTGDVTTSGAAATIADSVTVTGWVMGASTATTPAIDDNDTSLATTAFVNAEIDDDLDTSAELIALVDDETGTGALVFGTSPTFTTSVALPQGLTPTVDVAGEIAVDTTDDQLIYYGGAKRVIPYERTVCFVIENLAAADDSYAFYMANDAITITGVGCNCRGTCTTAATFTLEDRGGNAMTITGTNPTCATTGAATFAAVTAANGLTAGEMAAFDVTNAVSPETDEYSLCITYTVDAQ